MTYESERLMFRPWTVDDAEECFALSSDERVGPMCGWLPHKNVEETKAILEGVLINDHTFCIIEKSSGKIVGNMGIDYVYSEGEGGKKVRVEDEREPPLLLKLCRFLLNAVALLRQHLAVEPSPFPIGKYSAPQHFAVQFLYLLAKVSFKVLFCFEALEIFIALLVESPYESQFHSLLVFVDTTCVVGHLLISIHYRVARHLGNHVQCLAHFSNSLSFLSSIVPYAYACSSLALITQ